MSIPIAFLICTEPGRLENESLLLAESIRKFGGRLKDVPIYSFHPRNGKSISSETKNQFELLNVVHQQIVLNTDFVHYPLANKPLICSYAEQNIDADILVFLDSDKCIFQEPKELILSAEYDIAVRPEFGKSIGSSGRWDSQEGYWQKLYQLFDVRREVFVTTPIGNKRIRGYWNSGMVAVRRSAGVFTAWETNFRKAMDLKIQTPHGIYMIEQSLLAITACAMDINIHTLPVSYNYALPLHNRISKPNKLNSFDDIVSIHYFKLFAYNNWQQRLKQLRNLDCTSEKYEWMCERITQSPKIDYTIWQDYVRKFRRIKNELKLFNPL